tara:strand:+ start:2342 stop:2464 length:123 start_codon:yes stop_codon:yes gene_type:complete
MQISKNNERGNLLNNKKAAQEIHLTFNAEFLANLIKGLSK